MTQTHLPDDDRRRAAVSSDPQASRARATAADVGLAEEEAGEVNAREAAVERDRLVRERLQHDGHVIRNLAGIPRPTRTEPSARELEVLAHAASGASNSEIAELLFLSPETVKCHMKHVIRKLDARDRTHAVALALRVGLID